MLTRARDRGARTHPKGPGSAPLFLLFDVSQEGASEMLDTIQRSEMLATTQDGILGYFIGGRFVPRMAGGETPPAPGEGDTPPGEAGKDGKPFDAARAQATIDAQRAEVEAAVRSGKATATELAKAQARLKELDDATKSETEKLAASAKEASEKLTASEARAQDLAIRLSVERAARKLNFIDDDDAYRLVDRKAIELDESGDPTNVEALLTALAKAKPHLVTGGETVPAAKKGTPPASKPATNGKAPTTDELLARAKGQGYATF